MGWGQNLQQYIDLGIQDCIRHAWMSWQAKEAAETEVSYRWTQWCHTMTCKDRVFVSTLRKPGILMHAIDQDSLMQFCWSGWVSIYSGRTTVEVAQISGSSFQDDVHWTTKCDYFLTHGWTITKIQRIASRWPVELLSQDTVNIRSPLNQNIITLLRVLSVERLLALAVRSMAIAHVRITATHRNKWQRLTCSILYSLPCTLTFGYCRN